MPDLITQESTLASPMPWQQQTWASLVDQYRHNRLHHAILLAGPQGIGKWQLAMTLGQFLLCQQPDSELACGNCRHCQLSRAQTHPDLFLLQPKEEGRQIVAEQVRELGGFITQAAHQAGNRVVIIHPAETMNTHAANSLLKNLEEPGANTFFILVSHRPGSLMATVRSRCVLQPLCIPEREQALGWLQQERVNAEDSRETLESVLAIAQGQPLTARHYLREKVLDTYQRIQDSAVDLAVAELSAVEAAAIWKQQPEQVLEWLLSWLQHLASVEAQVDERSNWVLGAERLSPLGSRVSPIRLHRLISRLLVALRQMRGTANPNKQLLLEELAVCWKYSFRE